MVWRPLDDLIRLAPLASRTQLRQQHVLVHRLIKLRMADAQQPVAEQAQQAHRLFVQATASDRGDAGKGTFVQNVCLSCSKC